MRISDESSDVCSSDLRPHRRAAFLRLKQHPYIPTLIQQFADKQVGRRDFLRTATLLGMSAASAYGLVGRFDGLAGPVRAQEAKPKGGTLRLSTTAYDVKSPANASPTPHPLTYAQADHNLNRTKWKNGV